MSHGLFIIAAFAVTALGTGWMAATSWLSMRRSEALAEDMGKRR
jgi:hypothetical protein